MTVLVIDPNQMFRHTFKATETAPGLARAFLGQLLDLWGVDADSADSGLLLLSELATNALNHAQPSPQSGRIPASRTGEPPAPYIGVGARISATCLYVEVWDNSTMPPTLLHAAADDEHGRGVGIVATLAHRWGSAPAAQGGKIVWFELRLSVPPRPRTARPENEPAAQPGTQPATGRPAAPPQPPRIEPLPRRQHRRAPVAHPPPRQPQPARHASRRDFRRAASRYDVGRVAVQQLETALRSLHTQPA